MITADQHWRWFTEFAEYELATGGPDPHAKYVGILAQPCDWKERVWRGGLYSAVYTAPTAEAIWRAWPYQRVAESSQGALLEWLTTHWAGLPLRRERRAVRTPEKLARCLWSYHQWMEYQLVPYVENLHPDPYKAYESMWGFADKALYGFGRYALTKLLDFYEQYCDVPIRMGDIRPVGGWSPRLTLALLFPQAHLDARSNSPGNIADADLWALIGQERLRDEGLELDWFRYEVMLCEYRQSVERERQYPGRSIDSELKYLQAVEHYWDAYAGSIDWSYRSDIWQVRQNIHPVECLGEYNGWDGPRDDLGGFLNASERTWSDQLWDYNAYRAGPVKEKEGGRDRIRDLARTALGKGAHEQSVAER